MGRLRSQIAPAARIDAPARVPPARRRTIRSVTGSPRATRPVSSPELTDVEKNFVELEAEGYGNFVGAPIRNLPQAVQSQILDTDAYQPLEGRSDIRVMECLDRDRQMLVVSAHQEVNILLTVTWPGGRAEFRFEKLQIRRVSRIYPDECGESARGKEKWTPFVGQYGSHFKVDSTVHYAAESTGVIPS